MADLPADTVREIESIVTDWLHDTDVPGASVVVVDDSDELYAEGFGARDLESNAPATPGTLFGMGSITKSLTALAVVQLAEAGELSLEDPVEAYVDHYAEAPGEPITIRELLTHTSGMPANDPGLFAQTLAGRPAGIADRTDRERFVRESTTTRVTDGEHFFYYNTGYDVLGEVVEAVDGRSYPASLEQTVFEPLGMDRATVDPEALETDDDAMTGYSPGDDEDPPEQTPFPLDELDHPAGGLIASPRALSRFLRAMMTDGSFDGGRVCSAAAVDRLQTGRAVRQTFLDGVDQEYGYGWMRQPLGDDEVIGHGGSVLVSTAYAGFLADAGLGVVLACNTTADPHPSELGQGLLAVIDGGDLTAVPALALKEKCEAVTGVYTSFRGEYTATVERAEGGLSVTLESAVLDDQFHALPVTLDPDDYEFYTVTGAGARLPLTFDLDGDRADLLHSRVRLQRQAPGE